MMPESEGTMEKYSRLNPMQQEAVFYTEGPLLVLAGAGSGKTRVLTHRIAYLIEEKKVNPWNILAITFTNKAAGEMRERVDSIVGFGAEAVWVSTFHSMCVRILRRFIDLLGYKNSFTIYDTDDQKTLMKQVFKTLNLDPKQFKERAVMAQISAAKNAMIDAETYAADNSDRFPEKITVQCYLAYQEALQKNNALDFDDLLLLTVQLFKENPQVLEMYQERFRYIMVDEYQDTNTVQFRLVKQLAGKYHNLCVVGDDDQSIYRFRGADIRNILSFEKAFPGAKVIKLEQNYRSTGNILAAANEVIRNNRGRKDKTLWTANGEGEKAVFRMFDTGYDEADFIAGDIMKRRQKLSAEYSDFAVLYRTNAQSRLLEEKLIGYNIPYRLVGGVNFYQRREIKDILSYLRVIANGTDDLAVQRVLNVPKRGIGQTTVGKVAVFAQANDLSFYEALLHAANIPTLGKAAAKIGTFTGFIEEMRQKAADTPVAALIDEILNKTGYKEEIEAEGEEESQTRLENIDELRNKAVSYAASAETPSLDGFLEEVALVADIDSLDEKENRVVLMTLHAAKGLEFPHVYMSGMEDGLFPGMMSIMSGDSADMEEERRLCYVGITRAMLTLTMTAARTRMIHGDIRREMVSRFVEEIPENLVEKFDGFSSSRNQRERRMEQRMDDIPDAGIFRSSPYAPFGGSQAGGGNRTGHKTISKQPSFGKTFTVQKADSLEYGEGDRVKHVRFGEGTVVSVKDGGRDFEVTVEFDQVGVKKMFASFAKLQKI